MLHESLECHRRLALRSRSQPIEIRICAIQSDRNNRNASSSTEVVENSEYNFSSYAC